MALEPYTKPFGGKRNLDFEILDLAFSRRCALLTVIAICSVAFSERISLAQDLQQDEERQGKPLWSLEAPVDIWIWTGNAPAVFGHLASHLADGGCASTTRVDGDDLKTIETLCERLADANIGPWTSLGLAITDDDQVQAILFGTTDLSQRQLEDAIDVEGLKSRLGQEFEILVDVHDGQYVVSNSAAHFRAACRQIKDRNSDKEVPRAVQQTFAMLGSRGRRTRDEGDSAVFFYVDTNRVPKAANQLFKVLNAGVGSSNFFTESWNDLSAIESTGIGGRLIVENSDSESLREISVDVFVDLASPRNGFLANLRPVNLNNFPFTGDAVTQLFRIGVGELSEQHQTAEGSQAHLPFGLNAVVPESMVPHVVEAIYFVTTRKDQLGDPMLFGDVAYRLDDEAGSVPESIRECVGRNVLLHIGEAEFNSLRSVPDGEWLIWQADDSAVGRFVEKEDAMIDQDLNLKLTEADVASVDATGELAPDKVLASIEETSDSWRAGQLGRIAILREFRWLSYREWIFRYPIASSRLTELRSEPTSDQLLYRGSAMKAVQSLVEQFQGERIVAISGSVSRFVHRDSKESEAEAVADRTEADESLGVSLPRVTELLFGAVLIDQESGVLISGRLTLGPAF